MKKLSTCNVMVMRPTNHMISTRDHLYDLVTWPRHVTYELHPDIKSSSIPTSASWLHPSLSSVIQLLHLLIISARVVHRLEDLVRASSRGALEARKVNYFKINASPGNRWWWLDREECLKRYNRSLIKGKVPQSLQRPLGEPRVKW